jgi:type I restriction enzyme M protein
MADERTKPPYSQPSPIPAEYGWPSLIKKDSDELSLLIPWVSIAF